MVLPSVDAHCLSRVDGKVAARIGPTLREPGRRRLAAADALALGRGGVSQVSRACGLSRVTILQGIRDLAEPTLSESRVRRAGGGRKSLVTQDPALPQVLEALVEPLARGDPGVAAAMDVQEHADVGAGTHGAAASDQP